MATTPAPAETCALCGGTGWKMLTGAEGAPARAARCDCHFARRSAELLTAAQIPPRYQHCTLDNFITEGSRELILAHRTAIAYSRDYPGGVDRDCSGLLFYGGVGSGKTHLAVAIAAKLLERGIACRFVDHRALLKQIQATFDPTNPSTEARVVQPWLEIEVLILDDLGVGRATEWALETLHYILNHRYSHQLATLVTTNLEDSEARGRRLADAAEAGGQFSLAQVVGERLRSRLYEMCVFVALHGADFRHATAAPVVR
ncbi:MAG: ATP-binding protein [Terriglobales bacterium]